MQSNTVLFTKNASRYLQTLCKHFGHKIPTRFDAHVGRIDFPFGSCELKAENDQLVATAEAASEAEIAKVEDLVARHLERFAFRENPEIRWIRTQPPLLSSAVERSEIHDEFCY